MQVMYIVSMKIIRTIIIIKKLFQTLINPFPDLSDGEIERYFNYAAVWAFGGMLEAQHRDALSQWWRDTLSGSIDFPHEGTVRRDYCILTVCILIVIGQGAQVKGVLP